MRLSQHGDGEPFAQFIQLLNGDEHIHVVVAFRFNPEAELHVARNLCIFLEGNVKSSKAFLSLVADLRLSCHRLEGKCLLGGVNLELLILCPGKRELLLGPVGLEVKIVGIHNFESYTGSKFPSVTEVLEIAVEESPEILKPE
jgi:hypothetical protein